MSAAPSSRFPLRPHHATYSHLKDVRPAALGADEVAIRGLVFANLLKGPESRRGHPSLLHLAAAAS